MRERLEALCGEGLKAVAAAESLVHLAEIESSYLGRSGALTVQLKGLGKLDAEERPAIGKLANEIKQKLQQAFAKQQDVLQQQQLADDLASVGVDISLPGPTLKLGSVHPVMAIARELEQIFESMGFVIWDGPELESEVNNFDVLNIPKDHPARESHDTIWMKSAAGEERSCLRTHTSPVQVRALRELGAPLRVIAPGRVFRQEAQDATHEHTFHQMEGLVVGKGVGVPHMLHAMNSMLEGVFGRKLETRLRPGFFPFVEPGFELDARCPFCKSGCKVCKGSTWIELMPGGLVHPNVLEEAGVDSNEYTGFAFGLGLSRMAMLRYGIDDIRYMCSGDLRFLQQFKA
ncbi:MAG: phenylalanyl-tRNA synthetase alpha chain [Myxococcota bacterium]|jgi:phenylalanyl-tRNA synthetase alpha chain